MAVKSMDSVTVYDYNDVTQVRTWYKTVSRTSTAPTVSPTATEAQVRSNGWGITEPTVDTTKKLYTVQECMFGDGSYIWGAVSLSSSYEAAIQAYNKASAAENTATATAQYFWFNSTDSGAGEGAGAHITEMPREDFIDDPAHGGGNVLIDSDSVDIRDGTKVLSSFEQSGLHVQTYDSNDNPVEIAHLGYGEGRQPWSTLTTSNPYYSIGKRKTTTTEYNSAATYHEGDMCVHDGKIYVCNRKTKEPAAWNWQCWDYYRGNYSVAEGNNVIASGCGSHAEGINSMALGLCSHAEGSYESLSTTYIGPVASNYGAHAEGLSTYAGGYASHAEGVNTIADESATHAEGYGTIASCSCQHVEGMYNIEDANNTYAHIIGNGEDENSRSNALTVDWNGNVNIASGAKYKIGGANLKASDVGAAASSHTHTGSQVTSLASGLFSVTSGEVSTGSTSGGANKYGTKTVSNSGYYPLGIVGWYTSGTTTSGVSIYNLYLADRTSGSAVLHWGVHNVYASTTMNVTIAFRILWIKV